MEDVKPTGGPWKVYPETGDITKCGEVIPCYEISGKGGAATWIAQVMANKNPQNPGEGLRNAYRIGAADAMEEALECAEDANLAGRSDNETIAQLYLKWRPKMLPCFGEWAEDLDHETYIRLLSVRLRREALAKARGEAS